MAAAPAGQWDLRLGTTAGAGRRGAITFRHVGVASPICTPARCRRLARRPHGRHDRGGAADGDDRGVREESAAQNHRSMQEQVRLLIEREVRLHQPGAMERARSWRERMRERPMPQLLEDLRADRDR